MDLHQVSHFLQIWAFPPGLILLMFAIGFSLTRYYYQLGRIIIIFSFVLFWLFSTPIITQQLIDKLQNQYSPLAINDIHAASNLTKSAIVVLGSGVENALEYKSKHTLSDKTLSRLQYAVYLHQEIHLPIVVSGGNKDKTASTEAELMREVLTTLYHVPVQIVENKSRNTQDEARLLSPLLQAAGIKHIFLVTHAWHMPRSLMTFNHHLESANIEVTPAPMGYILLRSGDAFSNYLPLLTAFNTSVCALHEYVGLIWYRIFYRI